ncbi:hypothetical protein V6948_07910 [Fusobacterium varium]|uniref:hypothetical protein n=1 Tax=Fusobacterium varium TaxID=856 RepID=UPI002FEF7BB1
MKKEYNYEKMYEDFKIKPEMEYISAEEFAKNIEKCSIIKKIDINYNNLTDLKN